MENVGEFFFVTDQNTSISGLSVQIWVCRLDIFHRPLGIDGKGMSCPPFSSFVLLRLSKRVQPQPRLAQEHRLKRFGPSEETYQVLLESLAKTQRVTVESVYRLVEVS